MIRRITVSFLLLCVFTATLFAGITFQVKDNGPEGKFATGLVSSGATLYYLQSELGNLFQYDPIGDTWSNIGMTPFGGPWDGAGGLAYYNNMLIARSGDTLATYDIANGYWLQRGNDKFGNTGFTVLGDYLYGNAHASQVNQGGNLTRADLNNLDDAYCTRAAFSPSILGNDPDWDSRVTMQATVGSYVYGIKNDWRRNPRGTGDRLYKFDPNALTWNTFFGPNWDDWDRVNSTATDLGLLPLEPGYGSALVGLPPYWSSEIGAEGGLFIIFGQTNGDNEGWGDSSTSACALYDIATGVYTMYALPGITGSGTSAALHDSKIYIKRGGKTVWPYYDDPYNYDLYIATGNTTSVCDNPQNIAVSAQPFDVTISVTPADCEAKTGQQTPFTYKYGLNSYVELSCPIVPGYKVFWYVDGNQVSDQPKLVLLADGAKQVVAQFEPRCDYEHVIWQVSARDEYFNPLSIEIAVIPNDCGGNPSQITPFTSEWGFGETVTFTAPCVPGYRFVQWNLPNYGWWHDTNRSLTMLLDWSDSLEAEYATATVYNDLSLTFDTWITPVGGHSFANSLASDGLYLYFVKPDGTFYRTSDGCVWQTLATAPGSEPGNSISGALAVDNGYAYTRRKVNSEDVLCVYTIATNTWTAKGSRAFGNGAFLAMGNYLFGNAHATDTNQGGPVTRAELTNLDNYTCERTGISQSLSGQNANWMSRVVQFTELEGMIYGIKNDWSNENGKGDGDRLYRFNPEYYSPNFWMGTPGVDPLHLTWTSNTQTQAEDLGEIPFEPGYGSAMTALPPFWTTEIGPRGGLFIVWGRNNSNHEGWGTPNISYSLYDIATNTYTQGSLPGWSSSGTAAVYHDGKVFIKRGCNSESNPDSGANNELWVVTGTPVSTKELTVKSNPTNLDIILTNPASSGIPITRRTQFVELAKTGDSVILEALAVEGYTFVTWKVDGNPVSSNPITVTMSANHTAEAVYSGGATMVEATFADISAYSPNCNNYFNGRTVTWKVLGTGETGTATLNSSNTVSLNITSTGTRDICLKVDGALSRKVTGVNLNGGAVNLGTILVSFPDILNDDIWDDFELNEVNGGFGNTVTPGSGGDYNCDGIYDDFDLNQINGGFGSTGDCYGL